MTTGLAPQPVTALRECMDQLLVRDLTPLDADELLDVVRECEVVTRQMAAVGHRLIAELDSRAVASERGLRDTAALLRRLLRITPGEAHARVRAAADLGPRRELSGAGLPPLFPAVAAAQCEGAISVRHAAVITTLIDRLPVTVQVAHGADLETGMVEHARHFDPTELAALARRHEAHLDPDGVLATDADHARRREARLRANHDGSAELTAHLTPAALAVWQAVLDPLAAPTPAANGQRDDRTPGQRLHDGLLDAGLRLLRSTLPDSGGTPATVLVTMTLDQLQARTGLARTGHGAPISIPEALQLAAEADVVPVVLNTAGGILAYGRTRRTASSAQRRALSARDGGCSFPGCTVPAAWTQTHHIVAWADDGPTNLDNLTLLCGYHHRTFRQHGWTCHVTNGIPQWTPPRWIDPEQRPLTNCALTITLSASSLV